LFDLKLKNNNSNFLVGRGDRFMMKKNIADVIFAFIEI